jgi:Resolvase, N terminal domain
MKAPAVPRTQQQRKEAYGKEITVMYLRRSNKDKRDQERPRTWRAAIYLSERDSRVKANIGNELSIEVQRGLCRHQAKKLQAEVVGEFIDTRLYSLLWPQLHQALELAQEERLDYLIISSLDRLPSDRKNAFEVAWRLGHAGTIPMPVGEDW